MNDVVNPNTGLYHDQSLFNSTYVAKPLLLVRLFVENRDNTSVQFEKKNIWDDNFFFFQKKILVVFAPRLELGTSRV